MYDGNVGLNPCAYLHNYGGDGALTSDCYSHYLQLAPVFPKEEADRSIFWSHNT